MSKRITLTDDEAIKLLGYKNKTGRYKFEDHQRALDVAKQRDNLRFESYCNDNGINQDDVSLYWDKSKDFSILVRPKESADILNKDYIKDVISSLQFKDVTEPIYISTSNEILRVIITDVHVGMETDDTGYGLYKQVWNESVLMSRINIIISEISRIKREFKEVHVIDLGDYMDGLDGQTTRGGHNLPQNMSNRKAFKVGVKFKVDLYNRIQKILKCKLVAYNVCNDNHSSDFGFIVNETVKQVCELQNGNIKVNNLERFISHYTYGKHCFILCHGKDESHMKFGFKPKLDAVIKDKIMQYIKHYDIKSEFITFEKGDSHQQLLDSTSSEDFEYNNYRALSPASSWVKHNFKLGTCGFTLMTVREDKKSKGIESIEF